MEPEGSLPHSQVSLSLSWASSIQSHVLKIHLNIILPSKPGLPPPVVSFPQISSPEPCIRLSSPPYALHAPPISFFMVLSPEQYLVSSTDH